MFRYAARAVPWPSLALASVLVLVLMEIVRRWPYPMWPLEGCAVGLVAAAAAWCFDEPAAEVVDTVPRSLVWRTAARFSGVVLLLGVWALAVICTRDSLFGHAREVAGQGMAAALGAAAYVTWRRAAGQRTPGRPAATAIVPVAAFWALVRPLADHVPVFPYTARADWGASRALWLTAGLAAVALLGVVLADARWWAARRRRPPRPA